MDGHLNLQHLYLGTLIIGAAIFAWFISKDAKKYMGSENSFMKIHNSIITALTYINENMRDNGRYIFLRNIKQKFNINKVVYNTTSHARMLYSLYLCEKELKIPGLDERRRTSARYFVDEYIKPIGFGRYAVISKPEEENLTCEKAKLSSTAMALVGLSDLRKEEIVPEEIYEGMGQFLIFMQMKTGQFYNCYDIENGGIGTESFNLNYTGDAPLGLLYLYEFNQKKKWLDTAKKGLLFLANLRKKRKEVQFDYSSMLATEKLLNTPNNGLTAEEKELLILHLHQMIENVIPKQLVNKDEQTYGTILANVQLLNISCIIEGLIATYNCTEDDLLKKRIMKSINTGIKVLRVAQIQKGPLKGGFPTSADWKEIGVPKNYMIRLDTVQHALAAYVKYQTIFKD